MSHIHSAPFRLLRAAVLLTLLGGCSAFGPTGTNKAVSSLTKPDANGDVVLTFTGDGNAKSATFSVRNKAEDIDLGTLVDDSPDGANAGTPCENAETGDFCVTFKANLLPANVYIADVYFDDETEPVGTVPFFAGGSSGATDTAETEPASGEAATEEDPAATDS